MTRSRVLAPALLLAVASVASACPKTPPSEPEERPVPGGTLRVSVRDLQSLDPARASGRGALQAASMLYEPLVRYDGAADKLVAGAASRWSVSADGTRWRFTIAGRFADGNPVTAADVKFAFDRLARRDVRADAAFLLERVRGFREARVTGKASGLSGITVVARSLVEFHLDRPFYEFPYLLTHPALVPLPAARYAKAARLPDIPVGNGPYRATLFEAGAEARLARNERYLGASPYLDEIVLQVARSVDDGWRAFTGNETDVAEIPDRILDPNPAQTGGSGPLWATLYLGPNIALGKYRDAAVRRAISQAIDRAAIVSGVYDGEQLAADAIVPPGVRGALAGACRACAHDATAARAALRGKKLTVRIDHLDDARSKRLGQLVVAQLRAVGVRASARAYQRAAYEELLRRSQHDLAQLGFPNDVTSPDGALAQQLLSGSVNNQVAYKDAAFDALIARARGAALESSRLAFYRRAEARALDAMALIPLVTFRNRSAIATGVRGLTLDGLGVFDARTVWLASI